MRGTLIERLLNRIIPEPNSGCWLWTGCLTGAGYGQIRDGRATLYAHIVSYQNFVGPIPEGLELDHLCRVPCCANPHHLEPVTHIENMRRGVAFERLAISCAAKKANPYCVHGHERNEKNTGIYIGKTGIVFRRCRICHKLRARIKKGSSLPHVA